MLCPIGRLRNRRLLHGPTQFQCRSWSMMRACFPNRGCRQSLIRLAVRFTFCKEDSGCKFHSTWRNGSVSPNVRRVFRPQRAFSITSQTFEHALAEVDISCVARVVFVGALDSSVYHTRHVCSLDLSLCVTALYHLTSCISRERETAHTRAVATISNAFLFRPVDSDISCSSEVI
jgi:hypothetical protein